MVSTYLSYDLINRDMKASINRVSQQAMVSRQTDYYKENIGKVTSVDDFMKDYQLYSYAMDAFGLGEMTYAKAFMKKVLESDLNDENSFANKLSDERYRDFAAAFNFTKPTATVQTGAQLDAMIGLYDTTISNADAALGEETRYYGIMIDQVSSVDRLLRDDRMRAYVFQVFNIDEATYSYSHIKGLMTSDLNDPNSYFNQNYGARLTAAEDRVQLKTDLELREQTATRVTTLQTALAGYLDADTRTAYETELTERQAQFAELDGRLPARSEAQALITTITSELSGLNSTINSLSAMRQIAAAFDFNADGSVTPGSAQTDETTKLMQDAYVLSSPRLTTTVATLNRDYYQSTIGLVTSVNQIAGSTAQRDDRLLSYIRTAFDLNDVTIVPATIANILTADLNDPDNYVARVGKNDPRYIALNQAFNFQTDGTLAAGTSAQTQTQIATTSSGYMTHYNDANEVADEKAKKLYNSDIQSVKSLEDFIESSAVYNYALKAVGLDPATATPRVIREVLKSDLQDPKSYVYTLKDDRYVKLAEFFNFTADGSIGAPVLAQSELEMQTVAANYIKAKSAFGTEDEKKVAKLEAEYYSGEIQKIKTLKELLGNPRLMAFAMDSFGIDPASVTAKQLSDIFTSDLDDPKSYINAEADPAFRGLVTSFNFGTDGKMLREDRNAIQSRRGLYETLDNYLQQTLETQSGEENSGVRLALYFQRMAKGTTSYYTILADTALQQFINVTFGIPDELGNAGVDTQVTMMKKYFDIKDFQDPEKLKKMIARFTIMYDDQSGATAPVLALFNGNTSISADTLLAVATLRAR